ncbi:MAG TPA: SRPBCC family protein [Verrucomicrobiae bacterium]|nr:SRPBCC family protein [Verrucomicrobiae bacterium]
MKEFLFATEIWLPRPPAEVFPFFADAGNLDLLTPPWLRFEILTPLPVEMKVGTLIDYRLRLHGWPIRWRTRIREWQPPVRFVDEQLRGPYWQWIHEHTFVEREGSTVVGDRVRYAVPGGALVNKLFVRRDVEKIFAYRQERLAARFGRVAGLRSFESGR